MQHYACSVVLLTLLLSHYEATRSRLARGCYKYTRAKDYGCKTVRQTYLPKYAFGSRNSNLKISRIFHIILEEYYVIIITAIYPEDEDFWFNFQDGRVRGANQNTDFILHLTHLSSSTTEKQYGFL